LTSAVCLANPSLKAAEAPLIGGLERHEKISPRLAGKVLITELSCTACHASGNALMAPKGGPNLSEAGTRMSPFYMQRFIANPSATKPGTTMPDVLAHLPDADREDVALALAHYLVSLAPQPMRFERPAADAIERGNSLYHSVGCVACHSPETALTGSVPLGPLEEKYSLATLAAFLEDPLAMRPGGRMPGSRLDHFEAMDIASYLLRRQTAAMKPFVPDAKLAARGQSLFTQHRCDACHEGAGRRASPSLGALEKLRPDKGCLGDTSGPWPRYPLSSEQRDALKDSLGESAEPIEAKEQIELTLTRLNCLACHQRGDVGGVASNRNMFFTGMDENLGEQGRLPPPLTGVGAKLKREWLRDVVVNGASARPYLRVRMPRFGEAATASIVDLLKQHDHLPAAEFERARTADKPREVGRELAGSKGFNCIACHTFREKSAAPIRALDLTTMTARLEENWFHHYLANPQRFSPLTIMPSFWPDGKSPLPETLDGDPGKQRYALWSYLAQGPEAGEPRGLVFEPLIISVNDDAVMLRRSYPGIGKRGIGVGYPSGINLSFDAGQMRLASIWTGGFIEASGVWRGQGAGSVQVLGKDTAIFPAGPAFAVLESPATAWPTNLAKQAEGFQFQGYTLDAKQRPTFRYQFGELAVEDQFLDLKDATGRPHLVRTLKFPGGTPPRGLHLRLAVDKQIELRDERDYTIGKPLRLRLPATGIIRDTSGGRELLLPVTTTAPMTIEYHPTAKP
jgi:mono/diheme cytochrome c family protein